MALTGPMYYVRYYVKVTTSFITITVFILKRSIFELVLFGFTFKAFHQQWRARCWHLCLAAPPRML